MESPSPPRTLLSSKVLASAYEIIDIDATRKAPLPPLTDIAELSQTETITPTAAAPPLSRPVTKQAPTKGRQRRRSSISNQEDEGGPPPESNSRIRSRRTSISHAKQQSIQQTSIIEHFQAAVASAKTIANTFTQTLPLWQLMPANQMPSDPAQLMAVDPSHQRMYPKNKDKNPKLVVLNSDRKLWPPKELLDDDGEPIAEVEEQTPYYQHPADTLGLVKSNAVNEFTTLADEILVQLGDMEDAMELMARWKDHFLKQHVSSGVKSGLTLLMCKIHRSKTDLHEPLFELLRLVRLYSPPWSQKHQLLINLEQEYLANRLALDTAMHKTNELRAEITRIQRMGVYTTWARILRKAIAKVKRYGFQPKVKAVDSMDTAVSSPDNKISLEQTDYGGQNLDTEDLPTSPRDPSPNSIIDNTPKDRSHITKRLMAVAHAGLVLEMIPDYLDHLDPAEIRYSHYLCSSGHSSRFCRRPRRATKRSRSATRLASKFTSVRSALVRSNSADASDHVGYLDTYEREPSNDQLMAATYRPDQFTPPYYLLKEGGVAKLDNDTLAQKVQWQKLPEFTDDSNALYGAVHNYLDNIPRSISPQDSRQDLTPTVQESERTRFDEAARKESHRMFKPLELDKTWFSIQDVMELTLLHAEQMTVMRDYYENRIMELSPILNHADICASELRVLSPSVHPLMTNSPLPSRVLRAARKRTNVFDEESYGHDGWKEHGLDERKLQWPVKEKVKREAPVQYTQNEVERGSPASKIKHHEGNIWPGRKAPPKRVLPDCAIDSEYLKVNFYDRMKIFAKEKIDNHIKLSESERVRESEIRIQQMRGLQRGLASSQGDFSDLVPSFTPVLPKIAIHDQVGGGSDLFPPQTPVPKGGFQAHSGTSPKRPGILNLYDIALSEEERNGYTVVPRTGTPLPPVEHSPTSPRISREAIFISQPNQNNSAT